jgi:hypothetical protein
MAITIGDYSEPSGTTRSHDVQAAFYSPVKNWKYESWTQRSHTPSSDSP